MLTMRALKTSRVEQIVASVGLGLFIATLLIYSTSTIAFFTHPGFAGSAASMREFSQAMLVTATIFALIIFVLAARGLRLSQIALFISGSFLYAASSIAYACLALASSLPVFVIYCLAITTALGDVLLCLYFGRFYRRFTLRRALANICVASILSVSVYWLFSLLESFSVSLVFCVCVCLVVVCCVLILRVPDPDRHDNVSLPITTPRAFFSLARIVSTPLLGLIFCALAMSVLRGEITASFGQFIIATIVVAVILLVFIWFKPSNFNLQTLQLTFIPLFAIFLLAVNSISPHLGLDRHVTLFCAYLLYMVATIIALASLSAIANAGEFDSDLVFSVGVFLFSLVSALGVFFSNTVAIQGQDVDAAISIITITFAFVAVSDSYTHWRRMDDWKDSNRQDDGAGAGRASNTRTDIIQHCQRLAQTHSLTARELEILNFLAEGHSGAYISNVLFISPNTARTHIHNIYGKLGVNSREDILRLTRSQ